MDPSRRMVYPYTLTAKLVQFPYKHFWSYPSIFKCYVLALPITLYISYKLQKASYSPGNVERQKARRQKEHEEYLEHLEHLK